MAKPASQDPALRPISAWGRLSHELHHVQPLNDRSNLVLQDQGGIAFGNGRSYGDACLNPGRALWSTRGLDRFIEFDAETGLLECEAGVLLDEIITVALPRGWFLPVTPGTRFVTLGGAIANDVHGKNHHRKGTLGEHVQSLVLARTDGSRIVCSRDQRADWLQATIGGLGLTGVIVSARLRLMRTPGPWLQTETQAFEDIGGFFALARDAEPAWEYTVAWIDCVHGRGEALRGLFFRGNPIPHEAPAPTSRSHRVPLTPPLSLINRASLRAFNAAYYTANRLRETRRIQHFLPFFYPLDSLLEWNRVYGPRGFYQYQCVVPTASDPAATTDLLSAIRTSGQGSFLAVLKTFGPRTAPGLLSFPMAGTTLALDFPNEGARTESLFARLDAIVAGAGGRLYPAKDARMPRSLFERGYPALEAFARYRDPGISSAMSRRLMDY